MTSDNTEGRAGFVRDVARAQTAEEADGLRLAAARLEAFLGGDLTVWTETDTLALHQAAVRIQSHVSVLRPLEQRAAKPVAVLVPVGPPAGGLHIVRDGDRS